MDVVELRRLRLAGICNTNLELLRGHYDFAGVPGHELVADVVAAEDARPIGKRVVGEINLAYGLVSFAPKEWGGIARGGPCWGSSNIRRPLPSI